MAGISILLMNFLAFIVLGSSFIGFILFVTSIIMFLRRKKPQQGGKNKNGKMGATVLLIISLVFQIPLGISIAAITISSERQKVKEKEEFEAIEDKVYAQKEEWKSGFDYDGKRLVPVSILINSENYRSSGKNKNLEKIGTLVMDGSYNNYYSIYQITNDSGYDLYYVWVESFAGGVYYSRTFVDADDYDAVLEYYGTSDLSLSACWKSTPENTGIRNQWIKSDLYIDEKQDELMQLTHEVLDDVSDKKQTINTSEEGYGCIVLKIESGDGVFRLDLEIYTKDEEMMVWLNGYKVESEIVTKYNDMLLSLINDVQTELLLQAN